MYQIRQKIWETNSSSTHTLSIFSRHENQVYDIPEVMTVNESLEFGWGRDSHTNPDTKLSYLYQAIQYLSKYRGPVKVTETSEWKFILALLYAAGVKTVKIEHDSSEWGGYIDHGSELESFVEDILTDTDLLFGYLFDERSTINTGNDNGGEDDGAVDGADYVYEKGN